MVTLAVLNLIFLTLFLISWPIEPVLKKYYKKYDSYAEFILFTAQFILLALLVVSSFILNLTIIL